MEDVLNWQGQLVIENQRLTVKNAKMRESLERIVDIDKDYLELSDNYLKKRMMKDIARQALKEAE